MSRSQVHRGWLVRLGDLGLMAIALFLGGLATDATEAVPASYVAVNDVIGLAAIVSLCWRRRWPVQVALLTFVAAGVAPMAGGAAIVAVYSVAAEHRGRWLSLGMGAMYVVYLVSSGVSLVVFRDEDLGVLGGAVAGAVLTAAACGWGLAVRSRRELLAALAERAERAEADQHARIADARRGERARIASEMHDVLAHRLSLLSLQAGAIEVRAGASPDELATAAGVVRSSAHRALDDLRGVIGVLRDDDGVGVAPQPTIGDVTALVTECTTAGMRVELRDETSAGEVPADVGRHAYQVVREGLTNARKHAPGQPVLVAIAGCPGDGLAVEVTNPTPAPVPDTGVLPGCGVGLIGLRERAGLVGGTLEHGPDDGGYRLAAWLPWPA